MTMAKKRPAPAIATAATTITTDRVRLHITPLTAETASSILPPDTDLSTVSYHTLATFPESPFGFVDLPVAAAERLKKKLRGALFRGVKVRVEDARPEEWKERVVSKDDEGEDEGERRERKRVKREKKKEKQGKENEKEKKEKKKTKPNDEVEGVISAFQLPDERRVARGWVEKADRDGKKKKRGECLFKAAIPTNKMSLVKDNEEETKEGTVLGGTGKNKRSDERKGGKEEGGKKKKLIKEFENTQKFPSFLKESQLDPARRPADLVGEFVEDVGWVDGKGKLVEEQVKKGKGGRSEGGGGKKEKGRKGRKGEKASEALLSPAREGVGPGAVGEAVVTFDERTDRPEAADIASVSSEEAFYDVPEHQQASPKGDVAESSEAPVPEEPVVAASPRPKAESDAASDEGESESGQGQGEGEEPAVLQASPTTSSNNAVSTAVHPLQALYKPTALTLDTSVQSMNTLGFKFGFGGGDSDDGSDGDDDRHTTPYRSSAPTPDTAIGNKRFFSPTSSVSSRESNTFTPSTPCAPARHTACSDVPLLFVHEDSQFLKGMSVWQQVPTPKALVPKEGEAEGAGKGGGGEGEDGLGMAELWKKRFYEQRGEWNRDWKRRRREGLKQKRKRERNGPHGANGANRV